jgi:hypothetical protein
MREPCPKSALLIGLGLLLFAGGCGTGGPSAAGSGRVVHFVIINLSDCEWQIMLAPADGGPVRALHLADRESQEVDLAAGEYRIEQTALKGAKEIKSTRRLTVRLDPGQTYRWRLVTLLSAPASGAGGDPANNGNERER